MSKELYNLPDDWFREAAEQPGPPATDANWQMMAAKLDAHKKERRRIIFWWWFGGVFLAGALSLMVLLPKNALRSSTIDAKQKTPASVEQARYTVAKKSSPPLPANGSSANKNVEDTDAPKTTDGSNAVVSTLPSVNNNKRFAKKFQKIPNTDNRFFSNSSITKASQNNFFARAAEDDLMRYSLPVFSAEEWLTDSSRFLKHPQVAAKENSSSRKSQSAPKLPPHKNHFYLFGQLAPEWTYVHKRGTGAGTIRYGGGIGYTFAKKFAVQIGIYSTSKKYAAGKGDYKPKPGSYYDNPYRQIESVTANCHVLEIPIGLRYNILQKKHSNFFVLAALSSAVMKKEAYNYCYSNYGTLVNSKYTYKTGAFHLFSSATISAGVETSLGKKVDLNMAPYFTLPTKGIGEGKILLNSFGVQAGIKYRLPF
jgi:hypothetical protein